MTRRTRIAVAAVVLALAAWWLAGARHAQPQTPGTPPTRSTGQAAGPHDRLPGGARDAAGIPRARSPRIPFAPVTLVAPLWLSGGATVSGRVIDIRAQHPVAGVEVVFRGTTGETSTTTDRDGSYTVGLATGSYRAFVRDDTVLSIGRSDRVRLPSPPSADTAGVPDEALMTTVIANGDTDGVDLSVVRGGVVSGRVVDRSGQPIAGAVVRARSGGARPTLATDIAESDSDGRFELRLPAGAFDLDANHPRFAGITGPDTRIAVEPGDHLQTTVTLTAGCVIAGRVVGPGGKPAGDGAIERQWGTRDTEFAASGRIEPDGRFRWATTESGEIAIRAWPWKSAPSPARRFNCRDRARWSDVVFQIAEQRADLEGVLVDQTGEPVGFAYIDVTPLDPNGLAQQERTDASGHWEVYDLPPGRYRIAAQADARGVTTATVVSPRDGVRLELGGSGRLEGTTARLASGSFELVLGACLDVGGKLAIPQARQLVAVTGGRFAVDGLPACQLAFNAIWHGRSISQQVSIPSEGTARVELDLGPPRTKTVRGVVRDTAGQPLAGAVVTASHDGTTSATARTGASGGYSLNTVSGASISASLRGRTGVAQVGGADIDGEQVDLVVDDAEPGERTN